MSMNNYCLTPLEDWIKGLYESMGIFEPSQINLIEIAARLNVWVHYVCAGSRAVDRKGLYSMLIDKRLSPEEQWEDFGHELCHILRQAGNQLNMPHSFKEFQETKANNFAMHFCVPSFMLSKLEIPNYRSTAIELIASTFHVTTSFAKKRLAHYENQLLGFRFQNEYINLIYAAPATVNEEPKAIDVYSDIPLWERPDFLESIKRMPEELRQAYIRAIKAHYYAQKA